MRYDNTRTGTRRRRAAADKRQRASTPVSSATVVMIFQCALCLVLLAAIFSLRFLREESFETLGGYYKAVMGQRSDAAVSVGAFGEPLTYSDVYSFLSENRWSSTVTDGGYLSAIGSAVTDSGYPFAIDSTAIGGGYLSAIGSTVTDSGYLSAIGSAAVGGGHLSAIGSAAVGGGGSGEIYTGRIAFTARAVSPVGGYLSSDFGRRSDPFTGEPQYHTGIDIAAPQGADIYAALPGTVTFCGWDDDYGNYIRLTHAGGFETWYCHCSELLAPQGAVVRAGERIALVGSTGSSTGSHLHFTLYLGGKYADPMELFR